MPAANAPYLFSNFINGYAQGAHNAALERLDKVKNLMQLATLQAKNIDEVNTEEGRAAAWDQAQNTIKEAEKMMKPEKSVFQMLSGMFGKKDKNSLVDPVKQFGLAGMYGGGEQGQQGPAPMPRPSNLGPETEAAPAPSGFVQPKEGEQAVPNAMYANAPPQEQAPPAIPRNTPDQLNDLAGMPGTSSSPQADQRLRPDGVPENTQLAPASVGGPAGVEPQREVPPPPVSGVKPLPAPERAVGSATWFPNAEDVAFANKYGTPLGPGQVVKEKATGKGLELVRVGSGETQFWANGQPVTYGEYRDYRKEMLKEQFQSDARKGESAERLAEQTKQWEAQNKFTTESRIENAKNYEAWAVQNGVSPDKAKRVAAELRFGVPHEAPVLKTVRQTDENGDTWEGYVDLETKEMYPFKTKIADTQQMMDIKAILNDPKQWGTGEKPTIAKATEKYYEDRSKDNEAKDLARKLANQSAQLRLQSNRQLMDLRSKAASGKITKDMVEDAMKFIRPEAHAAAMETDPLTGTSKLSLSKYNDALYALLTGTLGVSWEKIYGAYGGDPRVAAEASGNEADKAARELSGAGPAYKPSN